MFSRFEQDGAGYFSVVLDDNYIANAEPAANDAHCNRGTLVLMNQVAYDSLPAAVQNHVAPSAVPHPPRVRSYLEDHLNDLWAQQPGPWDDLEATLDVRIFSGKNGVTLPATHPWGGPVELHEATIVLLPRASEVINGENLANLASTTNWQIRDLAYVRQTVEEFGFTWLFEPERSLDEVRIRAEHQRAEARVWLISAATGAASLVLGLVVVTRTLARSQRRFIALHFAQGARSPDLFKNQWALAWLGSCVIAALAGLVANHRYRDYVNPTTTYVMTLVFVSLACVLGAALQSAANRAEFTSFTRRHL